MTPNRELILGTRIFHTLSVQVSASSGISQGSTPGLEKFEAGTSMDLPFYRLEAINVSPGCGGQNSFGDEVKSAITFSDTYLRYGCRSALGTG